jgi:hypothetical protein
MRVTRKDIAIKTPPSGWLVIEAQIGDAIFRRKYLGYNKRTAVSIFLKEVNEEAKEET